MKMCPTQKQSDSRLEYWRQQIAEQQQSGQSVKAFCQSRALTEQSFYWWRKRLEQADVPVSFALVKTSRSDVLSAALELLLSTGEVLRIPSGVEAGLLRLVLSVLRERS
jgi:hypothetical protein